MRKLEYVDVFWHIEQIRTHHNNETYSWKMRVLFLDIVVIENKFGEEVLDKQHRVRNKIEADHSWN